MERDKTAQVDSAVSDNAGNPKPGNIQSPVAQDAGAPGKVRKPVPMSIQIIQALVALVIFGGLYVGSYCSLVAPYPPKEEFIRPGFQREPWYFERGYADAVAEVFFTPAHAIDVMIRPDYWKK